MSLSYFRITFNVVEGIPCPNQNGFRYFTRGLPNLKSYYDKRGHYPVYY